MLDFFPRQEFRTCGSPDDASVTFEPGARTAWHTHPLGQTLIVTVGCGRVQCEGGPVRGDPSTWGKRRASSPSAVAGVKLTPAVGDHMLAKSATLAF